MSLPPKLIEKDGRLYTITLMSEGLPDGVKDIACREQEAFEKVFGKTHASCFLWDLVVVRELLTRSNVDRATLHLRAVINRVGRSEYETSIQHGFDAFDVEIFRLSCVQADTAHRCRHYNQLVANVPSQTMFFNVCVVAHWLEIGANQQALHDINCVIRQLPT
ncbi:MAG: hypothetical protein ABJO27_14875 [Pseudoruegeria sp.]